MASMPLALSVHNLVSSVGADAGFAAVIGLAVLALLYFAHARETANLREEAAVLAQRLQDAEARLDAARRPQPVVAVPAPAPASSLAASQSIPFAPAGTAAPALSAATRVVPLPALASAAAAVPAAGSISVSRVAGAPAPGAATGPAEPEPAAGEAPPVPAPPVPPDPGAPIPAPTPAAVTAFRTAPATVAGAAGAPSAGPATNGSSAPTDAEPQGIAAPVAAPPPRPAAPPARPPDRDMFVSSRSARPSRVWRRLAVLVGLLIVAGAVAGVIIATSGTGSQNPPAPAGSGSSGSSITPAKPVFNPAHVTVAVLNGTNTNQLAHHVADRLAAEGFKEGTVATASNQTQTSTIVAYLPGASNRNAARHVAKTLNLPPSTVTPVDQAAQAVACPPPAACSANVIVTVGANLAATF
jgi:hypothetical protein